MEGERLGLADAEDGVGTLPWRRRKILAVASGGGHWVQLMRVAPALASHDLAFVTVNSAYRHQVGANRFYAVNDATRWNRVGLLALAMRILLILMKERPDVVISTGAAPGYFALRIAKWFGIQTVWIDSLANVEEVSLSGRRIGRFADLWLTQWQHLQQPDGPVFAGAVI
jgi:UDP-N-acetylglucosamine:LPS N-acetylglucosamine transferase